MIGTELTAQRFLDRAAEEFAKIDPTEMQALADTIETAWHARQFVFVIGNGGSGSNASHFCEDLNKCTLRRQDLDDKLKKRLRVLSLTDNTPFITALANDEGYDRVFVEQLKNFATPGDVLIAISGSGNSPNILRAVEWANENGLTTFACTGYSGGKLRPLAKRGLHVSLHDMGLVESIHLTVFHWVIGALYRRMNS